MGMLPYFRASDGVSEENIDKAEKTLNVQFASEYRSYLTKYGTVSVDGHELTGIHSSKRLNVVDVTILEKDRNSDIPENWYVLEQANIDDIVIWQNERGEIFQTCPGNKPMKIANSIVEYLSLDE